MEQLIVITPGNAQKHGLRLMIQQEKLPSTDLNIEISGEESEIADLRNDVCVYTSKERMKPEEIPKSAPSMCIPWLPARSFLDVPTKVKRIVDAKTTPGRQVWTVKFKVPRNKVNRTYIQVPPPKNVSDGITCILDLPAFAEKEFAP